MTPDIAQLLVGWQIDFWFSVLPVCLGFWLLKRVIFD